MDILYLVGDSASGSSPYSGAIVDKAPYLSIQSEGYIRFVFPKTASTLFLNWGSIGSADFAIFYSGNTEIGVLSGANLATVFGSSASANLSITSQVPFSRVVLQETSNCCFEFSNLSTR